MTPELEQTLVRRYPEIFRDVGGNPAETCMAFGLEVEDGWFDLIDTLCEALSLPLRQAQHRLEWKKANLGQQKYGNPITQLDVDEHERKVQALRDELPVAEQVKEKFGGLRFYARGGTSEQRSMIGLAEKMSSRICECCGNRGMTYRLGWHRTLCPEHADQQYGQEAAQQFRDKMRQARVAEPAA